MFPVSWDHSRINGFTGRINLVEHRGFSAFVVMAHTNAIFSPPGNGGILLEAPDGDFRIDHDQKFNATTNLQYTIDKALGAWVALSWRYDSGLVVGSVPSYADALALTADQQAAIGLYCGNTFASLGAPITSCSSANRGATRIVIPADGTEDDVTNPARIAPRNLFDLGVGVDNLLRRQRRQAPSACQRHQPDQQGRALQFPLDLQRHAFRDAARVPDSAGRQFLTLIG